MIFPWSWLRLVLWFFRTLFSIYPKSSTWVWSMVFVLAAYAQELKLCPLVGCPNLAHHMGILNGFQYGPRMRFKIFWFITFWRNEDLCHLISIWTSIILGYISYIFEKLMVIFIIAAVSLDTLLCISIMCYLTQCLILWCWKFSTIKLQGELDFSIQVGHTRKLVLCVLD